jgi:hypothetical protein
VLVSEAAVQWGMGVCMSSYLCVVWTFPFEGLGCVLVYCVEEWQGMNLRHRTRWHRRWRLLSLVAWLGCWDVCSFVVGFGSKDVCKRGDEWQRIGVE